MENYNNNNDNNNHDYSPLLSTPSNSQDYDNVVTSLGNLDLDNVVWDDQESSLTRYHHGGLDNAQYYLFSPQLRHVNWSNTHQGPRVLDHQSQWASHGNQGNLYSHVPSVLRNSFDTRRFIDDERMRINHFYGYSGMYNVANQHPGISMPYDAARAYEPSYSGGYTLNPNGYYGQGLTQTSSNGQNGYYDRGFTRKRSNVLHGYCRQGSTGTRSNTNLIKSMACLANPLEIVSTAMTREGSLCLQNLLLEGNQEIKTTILEGVLDHIHQLLMHQYGHHMIDKLVESCGDFEMQKVLEKLASEPDLLVRAACCKEGSSSIQKLIKHLKKSPHSWLLTSALAPKVVDLATNKTARHVFRECLNLLGSQANKGLYEEAIKNFDLLARDEVGCLALNDCIDFVTNHLERKRILQLVIDNAISLAYDPYGNFIVQNAVQIPECGHQICKKLRGHYIYLSTKKSGSHVVEKCMEACSSAVMHALEEILEKKQALELARNEYGNYVIQTALRATKKPDSNFHLRNSLLKALLAGVESLQETKAGKKLASRILDDCIGCK